MKQQLKLAGLAVLLGVAAHPAVAQEKLKIGVIVTLSGPAAALGQQVRDGFALAVRDLGGKMNGRDAHQDREPGQLQLLLHDFSSDRPACAAEIQPTLPQATLSGVRLFS